MFDVFYSGPKPNRFAFERPADSLEHAASMSRTRYYWYIYGGNDYADFDFSFEPPPWESDHVHVFPSQWQQDGEVYLANKDTVHNKQWHFRTEQTVTRKPPDNLLTHWHIPEEVNRSAVDFSWHPNPLDPPYIYHFGSSYQVSVGLTYTVDGATEIKFAGPAPGTDNPLEVLDIFFIDRGNPLAQPRYDRLAERHTVTKVRYANSIMDTVRRCATRAKTNKFWIISSEYDYSNFDFAWHAEPWQSHMTHVFPSQHNRWSDTFLINRWEFERHSAWATGLEQFPNLNFVTNQSVTKNENLHNIYYVDHANPESRTQYDLLKRFEPDIILTRFANSYIDTMRRIVSTADTEYVWILNSVCNYDFFDFTWQPEPWQREMIHCFCNASGHEKRGDTFYIHVESFRKQMVDLELLDWFNVINYVDTSLVDRWSVNTVYYETDNLIEAVQNHNFTAPYALFSNQKDLAVSGINTCLWSEKDRVITPFTHSKAVALIPRDIKRHLKTQIYDYPHLDRVYAGDFFAEKPLDIVYISNGEPDEERYYRNLEDEVYGNPFRDKRYTIKWVRGVDGRVAAYQEAARQSTTDWFFAVFAKLEVNDFDWCWQPDYWQQPKHYIFNARNPVNGLEYGHMGMIAYNKKLVLANNTPGIDFTLSQPHESVPILSGTAHFNQDAWTTWRTAFREVLKLRLFMATQPTLETEHRLATWLSTAQGNYSNYCLDGARDAVDYYDAVAGDPAQLQLSFDWQWLRSRYDAKY